MMGETNASQAEPDAGPELGEERAASAALAPSASATPATDSIADGVGVRSTYAVNLDVFEGPLDLLLHLVRRHELDILDIPIAFIAEKYIEYISFARSLDIEVAGEYLLMAATLAYLKSRELLPPVASEDEDEGDEEEGVDPREELIRRLIEYERFRDAGFALAERPIAGRDVFPRGGDIEIEPPEAGLAPVTLFRLAEAYNRVLDRARINADHEVVIERVTVRQRMGQLGSLLRTEPRFVFEDLFLRQTWSSEVELRQMLVVTLMSVLEMVKLGVLGIHQAQGSDTLELERVVEVEQLDRVVADFRGDDEIELDGDAEPGAETEATEAETAPVEVETAPAEVEAAPAETEAARAETEAPLAETEAAPVETEAAPAETEAAPAAAAEHESGGAEAESAAAEPEPETREMPSPDASADPEPHD